MYIKIFAQRAQFLSNLQATEAEIVQHQQAKLPIDHLTRRRSQDKLNLDDWADEHKRTIPDVRYNELQLFCSAYQSEPLFAGEVPPGWEGFAPLWQKYTHLTNRELKMIFTLALKYQVSFQWVGLELQYDNENFMQPEVIADMQEIARIPSLGFSLRCKTTPKESTGLWLRGATSFAIPLHRRMAPVQMVLECLLRGQYQSYIPEERWKEILDQELLDREECEIRSIAYNTGFANAGCNSSRQEYQEGISHLRSYNPQKVLTAIQLLLEPPRLGTSIVAWLRRIRIVDGYLDLPEFHR